MLCERCGHEQSDHVEGVWQCLVCKSHGINCPCFIKFVPPEQANKVPANANEGEKK
jgi:hypothetical protein